MMVEWGEAEPFGLYSIIDLETGGICFEPVIFLGITTTRFQPSGSWWAEPGMPLYLRQHWGSRGWTVDSYDLRNLKRNRLLTWPI